ncbi:SDR family NAD(P)-dependent oxidoreductase [Rhodococcus sp. G-MC3]|uniref:type I polyketide synthase n=1 Tax=Rhodococcus sp. G-MC3 TaxID=3046209 RepID=UPI0024BA9C25|nr:type I polyketide synthase [Rhodococcus sp. G-MC3]MDJ0392185.1 SDR family NAD(P)-dependent oxidoreductase [Rhodococcus sp. G-MC3]
MVEIALVGIGCRFPGGVHDGKSFWEFMISKGDGIVDIPEDRWNADRFYDPDPDAPGRMYTRKGGFLTQSLWDFDPEFFGISPREASVTDPQQRLLLEVAWEALDDGGHAGRVSGQPVGVYIGGFTNDSAGLRASSTGRPFINAHSATSSSHTLLSNRISYCLDLVGPSMTIDTACSSSLVAVHEAVRALERGECEMALVGGANTMIRPETFISMCKGRFLAFDGRSKSFDAAADGYGRGEGAGMVLLRPLADAIRDGDRIYSVIRGSGVNQDGRTIAIPVPNPVSQRALAERVCAEAGINPKDVGYVEAHGTGTSVGDPLELEALGGAYGAVDGRESALIVGSIKASIGHTEAAAGIASLIKSALSIHHRTIAPQAWLDTLNPAIPFDDLAIRIPTEVEPFPDHYDRPIIAINGFGYGGTNAHVVMETAPAAESPAVRPLPVRLFPLSARTDAAVRTLATSLADSLDSLLAGTEPDDVEPDDVDRTLRGFTAAAWTRRAHHPVRASLSFTDSTDLLSKLRDFAAGTGTTSHVVDTAGAAPVFVFSGMGPQWWGMARELLHAGGEFARTAQIVDDAFIEIAGWSIIEELCRDEEHSRVTNTEVAQPANFLVQVSLVAELRAAGIEPETVVGHSVGEVSAAYVSGALSLHDALLVSCHRARLQARTAGSGSMLAVGLSEADAVAYLAAAGEDMVAHVSVAAINSPTAVTLAGDVEHLTVLADKLTDGGYFAKRLQVEVPYHSHLMDPILADVATSLNELDPRVPKLALFSTVTAHEVTDASWGAAYWCDNVRKPVRFADTVSELIGRGHRVFLEIGPHPVLSGNIREIIIRTGDPGTSIGTLVRRESDAVSLNIALSNLYCAGSFDGRVFAAESALASPHVSLPAYPWQKTRVWTEDAASIADRMGSNTVYPMLGDRTSAAASEWQAELAVSQLPWLQDHVVDGLVLLPGTAYLDAALSAAAVRSGRGEVGLEHVEFVAPLVVDKHDVPVLQVAVEDSTRRFVIRSRSAADTVWTTNAIGRLVEGHFDAPFVDSSTTDMTADITDITGDILYPLLSAAGLQYGPAFQGIETARIGADVVVATIDSSRHTGSRHLVHPAVLDTALQCVATLASPNAVSGAVVPFSIAAVRRFGPIPRRATVIVRRTSTYPMRADIAVTDAEGRAAVTLGSVEFRPIAPPQSLHTRLGTVFYEPTWELRDNRDADAIGTEAARDFALVVTLGTPDPSAQQRAEAIAASRPASNIVNAEGTTVPELVAALREGMAIDGIDRATVIAVAGTFTDPASAVLSLLTVARTVHVAIYGDDTGPATEPGSVSAVVVTQRAFCMPGDVDGADLAHASLVGARRSLRNEQSPAAWRFIDTEPSTAVSEIAAETFAFGPFGSDVVDEVALRQGSRWVVILQNNLSEHLAVRDQPTVSKDPEQSFAVEVPSTKLLSDLAFRVHARRAPGHGEIEVRMEAVGLNYKDPLKVMGVLTDKELSGTYFGTTLGLEGAGTVTRIGDGVTDVAVGDKMGVCAREMMRRYITLGVDEGGTMKIPSRWESGWCSSILPFLCAEYGLVYLARVQPGETVLIHGAAGGMGLAAVQVARLMGARVIATAGTEERREVARAAGAHEVLASRSLNYSEEVMALTDGRGVDVVFNSSPGEIMAQNLHVAGEFARIIELGKADIYFGGVMDLKPFDRNITFYAVDMDRMFEHKPDLARQVTREVLDKMSAGTYRHLPYTTYTLDRVGEAFDSVIRSSHTGRVVLSFTEDSPVVRPEIPTVEIDPEATYVVTGGFGAFGTAIAKWLVDEGARTLVLVGRSGPTTDRARQTLAEFAEAGVTVVQELLDISDYDGVRGLLIRAQDSNAPVRGIFHTAGLVDNFAINDITDESLRNIFLPKVDGAVHLDRALDELGIDSDIFVMFSSMSSLTGGAPQVSYSAANSVLDALAWSRRQRGKAAFTVSWGSMSGGGMAEAKQQVVRYLDMLGFKNIDMDEATRFLRECLTLDIPHVALVGIDWEQWGLANPASASIPRFAAHIAAASTGGSGISALHAEILALPEDQRAEVLTFILAEQLALVMDVEAEAVDVQTPLPELGLDSLMAVEFAARVGKTVGLELSVLEFGRGHGLAAIGAKLAAGLTARGDGAATAAPAAAAPAGELLAVEVIPASDTILASGVPALSSSDSAGGN